MTDLIALARKRTRDNTRILSVAIERDTSGKPTTTIELLLEDEIEVEWCGEAGTEE